MKVNGGLHACVEAAVIILNNPKGILQQAAGLFHISARKNVIWSCEDSFSQLPFGGPFCG
jgi:hypothetical protein